MRPFSDFEDLYREIFEKLKASDEFCINFIELEKLLPSYFADFSSNVAEKIGDRLISDIFLLISDNRNNRSIVQICFIFDSYVKSTNFHRFSICLAKIFNRLLIELESIDIDDSKSIFSSILLFDLIQMYAILKSYFPEKLEKKSEKRIQKTLSRFKKLSILSSSIKNLISLGGVLFEKTSEIFVSRPFSFSFDDSDDKHSCKSEKCLKNFCFRRFFVNYLIDYRRSLFESSDDDLEMIVKFFLSTPSNADVDTVNKFVDDCQFYDRESIRKIFLRNIFSQAATFVEREFVFGADRSVWLKKLIDILFVSIDDDALSTNVAITNKFFRHVRKDFWTGELSNGVGQIENLEKIFAFFRVSTLNSFEFVYKCLLFSFLSISMKIVDKFKIENERKEKIFVVMMKLLSVLTSDEKIREEFLPKIESAVDQIVKIQMEFCSNFIASDVFVNLTLGFFEKLMNHSNFFTDAVTNSFLDRYRTTPTPYPSSKFVCSTILLILNSTKEFSSNSLSKLDEIIYEMFHHRHDDFREVLPCVTSLFSYKRTFSPSVELRTEKRCRKIFSTVVRILDGDDFDSFPACVKFLTNNDVLTTTCIDELPIKLHSWIIRENVPERKICGRSFARLSRYLSKNEFQRTFAELRETNFVWMINFSKFLFDEAATFDADRLGIIRTEMTRIFDFLPLFTSCQWSKGSNFEFITDLMEFYSAAVHDKFVKVPKNPLVRSIISSISTLNLSEFVSFGLNFDWIVDLLNDVLKNFHDISLNFVGNLINIISKLQYELILRSSSLTDSNGIEQNLSQVEENFRSAQKFSRLFSTLSSSTFSIDYKNVAPYLVSDFVDACRRSPTIVKKIHDVLLVGIYDLMDLFDEHSFSLLATNLNDSNKDIFRIFYQDYEKYYKYKGYV